jgi:multimeric flavodoxin WrbA
MKVTAFVGSARKKHSFTATVQFIHNLQSLGEIEYEIIALSDYNIGVCKGCILCLNKGEELCPLKDDRDMLIDKINNSDGIIFATPNYSFNVSGFMKIFLDRLGFIFHRPRFFGKAFTSIVVQGFYGGSKIINYFNFIGKALGFNVIKGCCINSLEPMTEKDQEKFNGIILIQSKKFYSVLTKKEYPAPTLFQLMIFRMSRTSVRILLNDNWRDFTYYKNNGWFGSDYYYPTHLNPIKKLLGTFFDFLFTRIYGRKVTENLLQPG